MSNYPDQIVVFFADVAGSTRMYEQLGDSVAHECIAESLGRIVQQGIHHHGRLIETIGDEVMMTFCQPKDAARAACEIQRLFATSTVQGRLVKVRIGFHFGPIEHTPEGHPFGDSVNVAARVVSLCESSRIIATQSSLTALHHSQEFNIRPYLRTRVKGKSEPLILEEVVWDNEDATSLFNMTHTMIKSPGLSLQLDYRGHQITLGTYRTSYVIGRGADCDLIIESSLASRRHCRLEFRWGQVFLVDHSTNGTYVQSQEGKREGDGVSMRLHRRELLLKGKGRISIGTPVEAADEACQVHFDIH